MSLSSIRSRYDVVVAGARCAGASTAMLLARAGLDVLVVDPLPRGRDTVSTHALMRGGVLQLHRWGLLDAVRRAGTPPIAVTTFDYGDEVIAVPIKPKDGVDALYAPRRTVLDPILEDGASSAGAQVVRGVSVAGVLRDGGGRVVGVRVSGEGARSKDVYADLVVGADGVRSKVARMVGAPVERTARHATASVYGYWPGLGRTDNRWYFRPGTGMGTIPTNEGDTCVFLSLPPTSFRAAVGDGLEARFRSAVEAIDPALAADMEGCGPSEGLKAFAGLPGFLRRCAGPGWALVGDAGYFRDPLTAHGITDALRDAELLAQGWVGARDEGMEEYRRGRDAAAVGLMEVTDAIASLAWTQEEVKSLHHRLSREMNTGIEALRSLRVA